MSERQSPYASNDPENSASATTHEQIPHSGSLPGSLRENPVNIYDNTTLPQAYNEQLLSTPMSAESLLSTHPVETQENTSIPAGWYPINQQGDQGYWDGREWTQQTPVVAEVKPKRRGVMTAVVTGVAATALTIGATVGVNAMNSKDSPDDTPTNPSTTSEITEKAPEATEKPVKQEVSTDTEFEELLNMPKPENWDELDAMTLEEFNQQPIETRVEYGGWLNRDYRHLAELWYAESNNPLDKLATEVTVNPDNTGEEAMVSIMSNIRGALTRHFEMYELDEVPNYTVLQRQKQLTASYLYPNSKSSVEWLRHVSNQDINGYVPGYYVLNDLSTADYTILNRSENYTVNVNGVDRVAIKLTIQLEDGEITETQLALIETPTKSAWVNILAE